MATSWAHNPKTSNACAGSSPAPEPRRGFLWYILAQTTKEEAWGGGNRLYRPAHRPPICINIRCFCQK